MSGNALYHAAAWSRYYGIVTSIGGKNEEEVSRLAGQVLVSALAVPVGSDTEALDELKGKNVRLTALLGLTRMPTRSGLLKDAVSICYCPWHLAQRRYLITALTRCAQIVTDNHQVLVQYIGSHLRSA